MHATFLVGPAGSGKTFRCLAEVRAELNRSTEGFPLLFLAPKQATYQIERELLADADLHGYTRLQILSFERLAHLVLSRVGAAAPRLLSEEGRVMVLRALLNQHHHELRIFHGSARLPGFAHQLSAALAELQRQQISPNALFETAEGLDKAQLADKLRDLGLMLREYVAWLERDELRDASSLLELAADSARRLVQAGEFRWEALWLEGFAEMTPQELALLTAILPGCERATLAFCAGRTTEADDDWLSPWIVAGGTITRCIEAVRSLRQGKVSIETLARDAEMGRFRASPALAHFEKFWARAEPFTGDGLPQQVRLLACMNAEAEATAAAHEILKYVRGGGRFRKVGVLLRSLGGYDDVIRRVFARYEIPFFVDRREPVGHHPLRELTRSALRMAAFDWQLEDWFAALKTGLACEDESEIDALEVEARSRGWSGRIWREPLNEPGLEAQEGVRRKVVPPFARFGSAVGANGKHLSGNELAEGLRALWDELRVPQTLEQWSNDADEQSAAVHRTVWDQMQTWLDDLRFAFAEQRLPLRDWLGIVESGLSHFTVGVVPPALDQVMIGAVDRSRNPDLDLAIVMGLNETVFPAPPAPPVLLSETDRAELESKNIFLGASSRCCAGHERYFGYIAFTRARRRLVLSWSAYDPTDSKLNPSCFVSHIRRIFPQVQIEEWRPAELWTDAEHVSELIPKLLTTANDQEFSQVLESPALKGLREKLRRFRTVSMNERLSPAIAENLYGRNLCTSITSLERFAACPFKFFVHSGLRAQERKLFEVDQKKVGDFQHQVLKTFHEEITAEGKKWRDVSPAEARERVRGIAERLAATFSHGLFVAAPRQRFAVRQLTRALEDFIEVIVGWMDRYEFDPAAVELRFDDRGNVPSWRLELGNGQTLVFSGSIDRVDLLKQTDGTGLCVVVDYKSSLRRVDPVLLANGIQLQLPAYLSVLRHLRDPQLWFGIERLVPAGVFYVSLKGQFKRGSDRNAVFAEAAEARRRAYRHFGYFDASRLKQFDSSPHADGGAFRGDQLNYRVTKSGKLHKRLPDALPPAEFIALLDRVENQLRELGRRIFAGEAAVDPYRHGQSTACEHCDYAPVCRIDSWTHVYRSLRPAT